jgi:branched-chain amino acid transport system permease protein
MDGHFVDISGARVFYVERGSGIPLLYVHGNTGSSRWFERVMDVPGCRAIALDLPNFGRSSPLPRDPDIDGYADAVIAFIAALGLDRPLLVGHSLGGAVAISLAARSPGLIRGLVLVDSSAPSGLVTPEDRHPLIDMMRTNRDFLAKALAATVPSLKDQDFFNALVDDATRMAVPAWIGNARALSSFDYRGRCVAFTGSVLVLWGRKDVIITEGMARETAEAFPHARLQVLEDIGHSPMVEDPSRFLSTVSGFVSELGKERA